MAAEVHHIRDYHPVPRSYHKNAPDIGRRRRGRKSNVVSFLKARAKHIAKRTEGSLPPSE